jgi:hypothetical protein
MLYYMPSMDKYVPLPLSHSFNAFFSRSIIVKDHSMAVMLAVSHQFLDLLIGFVVVEKVDVGYISVNGPTVISRKHNSLYCLKKLMLSL